jgi:hypothetical protein
MTVPLVVGVMGAGAMGQGFDGPGAAHVVTLAHAAVRTPGFVLGGFYDVEAERSSAAERKWGCPRSPRERAAWLDQPWDVICIATPDMRHAADLADVLARKPKAIVVEKPAAADPVDAVALLERAERLGIPVVVDFPRRWHRGVKVVRRAIDDRRLGEPVAAVFVYSGGSVHNAGHMMDLFYTWWGGTWAVTRRAPGALSLGRTGQRVAVSFVDLGEHPHYVWEMHVYCENGKVELSRSPETLEVSGAAPHPVYSTFSVLTPSEQLDMEEEPLLCRLFEDVARMIADPERAHAWARREVESHTFAQRVFEALEAPLGVLGEEVARPCHP